MFEIGQRTKFDYWGVNNSRPQKWVLNGTLLDHSYDTDCWWFLSDDEFDMPMSWTKCPYNQKAFSAHEEYLSPLYEVQEDDIEFSVEELL